MRKLQSLRKEREEAEMVATEARIRNELNFANNTRQQDALAEPSTSRKGKANKKGGHSSIDYPRTSLASAAKESDHNAEGDFKLPEKSFSKTSPDQKRSPEVISERESTPVMKETSGLTTPDQTVQSRQRENTVRDSSPLSMPTLPVTSPQKSRKSCLKSRVPVRRTESSCGTPSAAGSTVVSCSPSAISLPSTADATMRKLQFVTGKMKESALTDMIANPVATYLEENAGQMLDIGRVVDNLVETRSDFMDTLLNMLDEVEAVNEDSVDKQKKVATSLNTPPRESINVEECLRLQKDGHLDKTISPVREVSTANSDLVNKKNLVSSEESMVQETCKQPTSGSGNPASPTTDLFINDEAASVDSPPASGEVTTPPKAFQIENVDYSEVSSVPSELVDSGDNCSTRTEVTPIPTKGGEKNGASSSSVFKKQNNKDRMGHKALSSGGQLSPPKSSVPCKKSRANTENAAASGDGVVIPPVQAGCVAVPHASVGNDKNEKTSKSQKSHVSKSSSTSVEDHSGHETRKDGDVSEHETHGQTVSGKIPPVGEKAQVESSAQSHDVKRNTELDLQVHGPDRKNEESSATAVEVESSQGTNQKESPPVSRKRRRRSSPDFSHLKRPRPEPPRVPRPPPVAFPRTVTTRLASKKKNAQELSNFRVSMASVMFSLMNESLWRGSRIPDRDPERKQVTTFAEAARIIQQEKTNLPSMQRHQEAQQITVMYINNQGQMVPLDTSVQEGGMAASFSVVEDSSYLVDSNQVITVQDIVIDSSGNLTLIPQDGSEGRALEMVDSGQDDHNDWSKTTGSYLEEVPLLDLATAMDNALCRDTLGGSASPRSNTPSFSLASHHVTPTKKGSPKNSKPSMPHVFCAVTPNKPPSTPTLRGFPPATSALTPIRPITPRRRRQSSPKDQVEGTSTTAETEAEATKSLMTPVLLKEVLPASLGANKTPAKDDSAEYIREAATPYYTPSLSVASVQADTPGLRFLQQEGERLSHSENSCSEDSLSPFRFLRHKERKLGRSGAKALSRRAATESARKNLGLSIEKSLNRPKDKTCTLEMNLFTSPRSLPSPSAGKLLNTPKKPSESAPGGQDALAILRTPDKNLLLVSPRKIVRVSSPSQRQGDPIKILTPKKPPPPMFKMPSPAKRKKVSVESEKKRAVLIRVEKTSPLKNSFQSNWEATHDAHNFDQFRTNKNENATGTGTSNVQSLVTMAGGAARHRRQRSASASHGGGGSATSQHHHRPRHNRERRRHQTASSAFHVNMELVPQIKKIPKDPGRTTRVSDDENDIPSVLGLVRKNTDHDMKNVKQDLKKESREKNKKKNKKKKRASESFSHSLQMSKPRLFFGYGPCSQRTIPRTSVHRNIKLT